MRKNLAALEFDRGRENADGFHTSVEMLVESCKVEELSYVEWSNFPRLAIAMVSLDEWDKRNANEANVNGHPT